MTLAKIKDGKTWNAVPATSNKGEAATEFSVGWVNYLDGSDDWQAIDCIVTKTDSDFTVTKAPFNFSAPLFSDGEAFFEVDNNFDIFSKTKISADNYGLYITARNVTKVAGELFDINGDGRLDAVIYKQAYPSIDADLIYYIHHGRAPRLKKLVRFNSVLSSDTDIEFHYKYTDTPAITPSTLGDGVNRDDEATANRTKLKNGETISQNKGFHIKPFGVSENRGIGTKEIKIWDSTEDNYATGVTQKIASVNSDIKTDGSGYSILTKHIEASFFSGVTYPVYTDAESTFYPDPHTESTSVDGSCQRNGGSSGEDDDDKWDLEHDATDALQTFDSQDFLSFGRMESNVGGARNLFNFVRHFCLFDTSGITDTHTVTAATLKVYGIGTISLATSGATEMSPTTSVLVQTTPASNTALVNADYNQCGSVNNPDEGSDRVESSFPTADQYNDLDLNTTGIGWVAVDDVTKLGWRVVVDATDDKQDLNKYINMYKISSADEAGTSQDPKLVVTHSIVSTFTPKAMTMF